MTIAIRERPIIFSGPMVRAILAGAKTQTRRVIVPQPIESSSRTGPMWGHRDLAGYFADHIFAKCFIDLVRCPYGAVGDRLWVRETFTLAVNPDDSPSEGEDAEPHAIYRADWDDRKGWPVVTDGSEFHWSPSIHMPRWASRLTLEITGVRVERLQAITTHDIGAEGINLSNNHQGARNEYRQLWDALNAKRGYSWDSNPWVWVLSFRQLPS